MRIQLVSLAVAAVFAPAALADVTGGAFRIEAFNELGSGFVEFSSQGLTYHPELDTYTWQLEGPQEIRSSSGALLATLDQANAYYVADPIIGLHFVVTSGAVATTFTISSALLSFPTIDPAEAQASAGMTVTDMDGDGALATGLLTGPKAYGAYYNGFLATNFRNLVSPIAVGANGTGTDSESFGFSTIGSVTDMSSQWSFRLSANDAASGTSRYEVRLVPEPASLAALGLGVVALLRRRKN